MGTIPKTTLFRDKHWIFIRFFFFFFRCWLISIKNIHFPNVQCPEIRKRKGTYFSINLTFPNVYNSIDKLESIYILIVSLFCFLFYCLSFPNDIDIVLIIDTVLIMLP